MEITTDKKQIRFQRMVEEIVDYAILLLDTDGNIENWNKGAEKIKGYSTSEIIGKNFRIFYTPEDRRNNLPEKLIETARVHGSARSEGYRIRKDGTTFWGNILITAIHDNDNKVIGFTKITRDLTDKKLSEEKLRRSEDRYFKMIAEIQDYAILLMDTDGNIQNWNKGAEKIKGYSAEEIIGKNFRQFYTPKDKITKKPDRLLELARAAGRAQDEGWRVRKDGSTFWGSVTLTALHDDDGTVVGFSKVTRDLTEKKKTDEAQLHLQKMEARNRELEQITYITSHDLQEPLRNITSLIDLLLADYGHTLAPTALEYLRYTSEAAVRMRQLINGLLDYGRLGRNAEATEINSRNILDQVRADLDILIKETGAEIIAGEMPVVVGYETEFRLLLQNLISNAIKFRKPYVNPVIKIGAEQQNNIWKFSVSDNGIGIDPQHKDRIFIIFQRLHAREAYDGSGIGLAHCKKIIEMHNGQIWVDSEPGEGSTFSFTINTNAFLR